MVSLYIHIPFCKKKCPYCHFYVISDKESFKDQLLHSLKLEWQKICPILRGNKLESIYFGGGTPTLFEPKRLEQFLDWVYQEFHYGSDVEITIESNPELFVDYSSLRSLGINRLSFGVQSLHQNELSILERNHSPKESMLAVERAKLAGFDNISIDLMYDLPGQTEKSWSESLRIANSLPITHLSLYNLTIEPHTAFEKREKDLRAKMPDEESSAKMYSIAQEIMTDGGFTQYEISAFSRDNLYSRHNIGYWTGRHFYGLGPSAFSFDGQRRFRNVANLSRYCKLLESNACPVDFEEEIDVLKRKKELLALHLRLMQGADLKSYYPLEEETLKALESLKSLGLLEGTNSHIRLTKRGILFYDTVASELI